MNKRGRFSPYLVILLLIFLLAFATAQVSTSTNYNLDSYASGSGGENSSGNSKNSDIVVGETSGNSSSSLYNSLLGFFNTVIYDSVSPTIAFVLPTESRFDIVTDTLLVNVTSTDSSTLQVNISVYNSSGLVTRISNSTSFLYNFTTLSDGNYTFVANSTDKYNNKNGTSAVTIQKISSCLRQCNETIYSDGGNTVNSCTITADCYLNSNVCSDGVCDFGNFTLNTNRVLYTGYNGSGDAQTLNLNLSGNITFMTGSRVVFSGKNGSLWTGGSRGGSAGIFNISVPNLLNVQNARFIGNGGYSTVSSISGGNAGILQLNYHGLIRNMTALQGGIAPTLIRGNSTSGTLGDVGLLLMIKSLSCPRDADPSGDGRVTSTDVNGVDAKYGALSTDISTNSSSDFDVNYDITCNNKINIPDIAYVGFEFQTR